MAENVAEGLPRVKVRRGEPGILSIPQARALLHAALENPDPGFGPYVTLGLFCGVRSSELRQLTWRDVRVSEKFVNIPNSVAKRRIRNIPLEANAIAWLSAFGIQNSGPICPSGAAKKFNRLIEKANELCAREGSSQAPEKFAPILEWPDNALRHSAASYFYAWTGNAQETCARLGQKNDDVLFNHDRALIRRDDGAAFYALMPPSNDFEPLILTAEANAA